MAFALGACFTGGYLEGVECTHDHECGPHLQCVEGHCGGTSGASETGPGDTTGTSAATTGPGATTIGSVTTAAGSDSDDTSTGEATTVDPTTTGDECTEDADCSDVDPSRPYCSGDGFCVDCTEISCPVRAPGSPACDPVSGQCVECTPQYPAACTGATPVCDPEANACAPCTEHAECPSGACRMSTGACFPEDTALWVDRLGSNCASADGSVEKPFCEIDKAVDAVGEGSPTVILVKPTGPYGEKVLVPANKIVAVVGDPNTVMPYRLIVTDDASVQVNPGAEVYLDRALIDGDGDIEVSGVICSGASLWIDRSEIHGEAGVGLGAQDCEIVMRRTLIHDDEGGGLDISGGTLRVENSMIAVNGGVFSPIGGIRVGGGAFVDIVYSTVLFNAAQTPETLLCDVDVTGWVRNSILLAGANEGISCENVTISHSAVDTVLGFNDGGANMFFNPAEVDPMWFVDPVLGDAHLTPSGATTLADIALWMEGDPTTDVDGDPRDPGTGHPGADVPQ